MKKSFDYAIGETVEWNGMTLVKTVQGTGELTNQESEEIWKCKKSGKKYSPALRFEQGLSGPDFESY
jgi:hypothetical protein